MKIAGKRGLYQKTLKSGFFVQIGKFSKTREYQTVDRIHCDIPTLSGHKANFPEKT